MIWGRGGLRVFRTSKSSPLSSQCPCPPGSYFLHTKTDITISFSMEEQNFYPSLTPSLVFPPRPPAGLSSSIPDRSSNVRADHHLPKQSSQRTFPPHNQAPLWPLLSLLSDYSPGHLSTLPEGQKLCLVVQRPFTDP